MNLRILLAISLLFASLTAYAAKSGIGTIFGALIGDTVGNAVGKSATSRLMVDEALVKATDQINKQLPMTVDRDTRLDLTVAGPGRRITYHYTIVTARASDIDTSDFKQAMDSHLRNSVCTSPDMRVLIKNDVVVAYSYRGNDGRHVFKIEITPAVCRLNDNSAKTDFSDNLPADTRAKLKKFVGKDVDEMEIARCTQKVEKIISGLVKTDDYRKIAIATKVKMAVNAPKQNVINMITNSYPGIITDRMAANIFDALAEP